jgi:hypothetical protein
MPVSSVRFQPSLRLMWVIHPSDCTKRVVAQARSRLAGVMPEARLALWITAAASRMAASAIPASSPVIRREQLPGELRSAVEGEN